ncbi:MAG: hybrid sensor histidine kinase/response regulator [Rickettsiales bacterium]|nr:hybrid sensor histidine kinase/response regulator [Rickettsiales bacterium]
MVVLEKLSRFCTNRINQYGAPYTIFSIFGVINYPLAYFLRAYFAHVSFDELIIRGAAFLLSVILLLRELWPKRLKKYLALYWYGMVTFVVPVLATYLLLQNTDSLWWLINYTTAALIFIMVLDCFAFLVLFPVGFFVGVAMFYMKNNSLVWVSGAEHTLIAMYLFVHSFVIGVLFTRNKEVFATTLLHNKDVLNSVLEEKVKMRTLSLNEALRVKDEFLRNINHEIRTPVQVISGASSLLIDNYDNYDEIKKQNLLKQLHLNSQRLFKLVTSVLDFLKFKQGKMILEKQLCDMVVLVNNAVEEIRFFADQKNISIELENLLDGSKDIYVDKDQIMRLMNNLLSNAIKYSDANNKIIVCIKEKTQTVRNGVVLDCLEVSVLDRGVGVPDEEKIAIFNSFTQSTRTNNNAGSSGLGLAIVAEIVYSHNGVLNVEDNIGGGSVFSFAIPYNFEISKNAVKKDRNKILFVDDDQGCCVVGSMVLESEGFDVHSVNNGIDAMQYLSDHYDDVGMVFLDIMMPGMSGIECLQNIKSSSFLKSIPVVMQTGIGNEVELKEAVSLGANGYISKPYIKDKLIEVISDVMRFH